MTRVLVTGGTGSLGSALGRHLIDAGQDVAVLIPPGAPLGGLRDHAGRFEARTGDLRDPDSLTAALRGITDVYHVAGEPILLNRLATRMWAINAAGAEAMAEAAARAGVRRFVHTSSVSAIGYPPEGEIADETFDFARSVAHNAYSTTKRSGEEAVLRIGARTDLDVVVVNPGGVLAPYSHRRHGWAAMVERARCGKLTTWLPGGVSVCAADDLVAGQVGAMRDGTAGHRYILTTANLSYRELFTLTCSALDVDPPTRGAPAFAVQAAAGLVGLCARLLSDPVRSPLLVPENAALGVRHLYYDASKARRELGLPIGDLRESIRAVDRWLSEEDSRAAALR
ncbi:MAG TPA: NAD-dependent epimerase/dehydratase family protein [Pseudonocardiaceae bacterium]